jgi:hypothetical protein
MRSLRAGIKFKPAGLPRLIECLQLHILASFCKIKTSLAGGEGSTQRVSGREGGDNVAGIEFIAANGSGPGVRLRKRPRAKPCARWRPWDHPRICVQAHSPQPRHRELASFCKMTLCMRRPAKYGAHGQRGA